MLDHELLQCDAVRSAKAADARMEIETVPVTGEDHDVILDNVGGHRFTFDPEGPVRGRESEQGERDLDDLLRLVFQGLDGWTGRDRSHNGNADRVREETTLARVVYSEHLPLSGEEPGEVNIIHTAKFCEKACVGYSTPALIL